MVNLTRAHNELFRRMPDEMFPSLQALADHSRQRKELSVERWERPQDITITSDLTLAGRRRQSGLPTKRLVFYATLSSGSHRERDRESSHS